MKILLVDDDHIVLKSLKALIPWQDLGVDEVFEAKNGEAAFAVAREIKPDIILTDIKMPVMDGLELARKISAEMDDVHIIILSAHEDFAYAKQAMRFGVKSYILKPLDREKISQLCEEVRNLVEIKRNKRNTLKRINSDKLESSTVEALKKSDMAYVSRIFEKDLHDGNITISEVSGICLKFINILFSYFRLVGITNKPLNKSRDDIFEGFYRLKLRNEMINYTYQLYLDVLQFMEQKKDMHSEAIMECVKKLIYENYYNCDLNVTYIAEKLNLSQSYLSFLSRQHMGVNISSYITQVRMEKAREFLKDPVIPVSEVAARAGYSDSNYFAKAFRKIVGKSPSEYRNLVIG